MKNLQCCSFLKSEKDKLIEIFNLKNESPLYKNVCDVTNYNYTCSLKFCDVGVPLVTFSLHLKEIRFTNGTLDARNFSCKTLKYVYYGLLLLYTWKYT